MKLIRCIKSIFLVATVIIVISLAYVDLKGNFFILKIYALYIFFAIGVLFLLITKIQKDIFLATTDILNKCDSLKHILFDVSTGSKTFFEEKRKFQRIKDRIIIEIVSSDSKELSRTIDISYEGAFFETAKNLNQDEIIDLKIYLPLFPQPICVKASVVRAKPSSEDARVFNVGVKYLDMSDLDRGKLKETLDMLEEE